MTPLALAAGVVGATVLDDLLATPALAHPRPVLVYAAAGAFAAALLALAPRVRSPLVTAGAGIAAGGALATVVGGLAWRNGVPDPLVHGGIAFNVADVAIAVGDALLIGGALAHAARNRGRLRQPV